MAGRKPGGPKTGGRKKGAPNKRTQELIDRIHEEVGEDFDPVLAMARLAATELERLARPDEHWDMDDAMEVARRMTTSKDFALSCLKEVSQYMHAKRKAMEVTGESGAPVTFQMVLGED